MNLLVSMRIYLRIQFINLQYWVECRPWILGVISAILGGIYVVSGASLEVLAMVNIESATTGGEAASAAATAATTSVGEASSTSGGAAGTNVTTSSSAQITSSEPISSISGNAATTITTPSTSGEVTSSVASQAATTGIDDTSTISGEAGSGGESVKSDLQTHGSLSPESSDNESVSSNSGTQGSFGNAPLDEKMEESELGVKRRHGNEDVVGQKRKKFMDTTGLKEALPEINSPRAQGGEGSLTPVPRPGITAEQLAALPNPTRESMAADHIARYKALRGEWWGGAIPPFDSDSSSSSD